MNALVQVHDLTVSGAAGTLVHSLSFSVNAGETLALIGESGSGKTLTAKAMSGLLPRGLAARGSEVIAGETIRLDQPEAAWRRSRGKRVTLLLQDPFTSLSPSHTCGQQIAQTLRAHGRTGKIEEAIVARLDEVGLPTEVARRYPHELSGGMRQRVAIAAAIAAEPELLIADEPTTALDATNQAEILDLIRRIQRARGMATVLITHDLGLVRGRSESVIVMRKGEVVEHRATAELLRDPSADYTRELIEADPALGTPSTSGRASEAAPLLTATDVSKSFREKQVLDHVSITLGRGEVLGIVGESGSGKTTLARCIAGLEREDSGLIELDGVALAPGRGSRRPDQIQMVFQDPYQSLNPMMTIGQILAEALGVAGRPNTEVPALLERVGLDPEFASRRPRDLSGGQRQRVAIARALAPKPSVIICDESVSALDVRVQAHILEVLSSLRAELGVSMLFISHDLAVVRQIADHAVVLRHGSVVESGPIGDVLDNPHDDYTKALVAAAHRTNPTEEDE